MDSACTAHAPATTPAEPVDQCSGERCDQYGGKQARRSDQAHRAGAGAIEGIHGGGDRERPSAGAGQQPRRQELCERAARRAKTGGFHPLSIAGVTFRCKRWAGPRANRKRINGRLRVRR
jgi:hypothetical protein